MSKSIIYIMPYMKRGWVAMDKNKNWHWFIHKPYISVKEGTTMWAMRRASPYNVISLSGCFDIEPVEDWTKSLMEIK
jgi:hypothetical protein